MTLAEVIPMLRNGATVDDVFKIAENKAAPAEAERQTSNVVSFAEARARARAGFFGNYRKDRPGGC